MAGLRRGEGLYRRKADKSLGGRHRSLISFPGSRHQPVNIQPWTTTGANPAYNLHRNGSKPGEDAKSFVCIRADWRCDPRPVDAAAGGSGQGVLQRPRLTTHSSAFRVRSTTQGQQQET